MDSRFLPSDSLSLDAIDETLARLTDSTPPPTVLCAWCPDFNPQAPIHKGASHGICPSCRARFEQVVA